MRDVLQASEGFQSAQDVYAALRAQGSPTGLSTVYRHLQVMAEDGSADMIRTADGEATYRLCGEATSAHHHHHLVCRSCGRVVEVSGPAVERWASRIAAENDFVEVGHTVEVFGVCKTCA